MEMTFKKLSIKQQNNRRRVFSLGNPILGEIESHAAMQIDVTYSVREFNKQLAFITQKLNSYNIALLNGHSSTSCTSFKM